MEYKVLYKVKSDGVWVEKHFHSEQEAMQELRSTKAQIKELWVKKRVGYVMVLSE